MLTNRNTSHTIHTKKGVVRTARFAGYRVPRPRRTAPRHRARRRPGPAASLDRRRSPGGRAAGSACGGRRTRVEVFVPCTATGHWPLARVRVPRQVYLSVPRKCTASAHFHALLGLALRRGTGRCLGRSLGRCMLFWLPAQVVELVLVPLPKVLRLALLRRKFRRERQPSHQHVHLV